MRFSTGGGFARAFVFFTLCLPLAHAHTFTIQDLGDLRGAETRPSGFSGEFVVGKVADSYDFIWTAQDGLQELSHRNSNQMPFINKSGDMVGIFWKKSNHWFWENSWSKSLYLRKADGSFADLKMPSIWDIRSVEEWKIGYASEKEELFKELSFWDKKDVSILAFNNKGEILLGNSTKIPEVNRFSLWNGELFIELNLPLDRVYKMDDRGVLLGRKWVKTDQGMAPFLVLYDWRRQETLEELIPDLHFISRELTQQGQVLLAQEIKGEERLVGLFWDPLEGWVDVGSFVPFKANRNGQMIGFVNGLGMALWDRGEVIDLEGALGVGGPQCVWSKITHLLDINDQGDVLGEGIFEGKRHGFLLRFSR